MSPAAAVAAIVNAEEVRMLEKLKGIEQAGLEALQSIQDEDGLESWRVNHLGRSSALMLLFNGFNQLSKDERPVVGQRANEVKKA
jgi:phenylalanyl-tRNA synthetase alpha chain